MADSQMPSTGQLTQALSAAQKAGSAEDVATIRGLLGRGGQAASPATAAGTATPTPAAPAGPSLNSLAQALGAARKAGNAGDVKTLQGLIAGAQKSSSASKPAASQSTGGILNTLKNIAGAAYSGVESAASSGTGGLTEVAGGALGAGLRKVGHLVDPNIPDMSFMQGIHAAQQNEQQDASAHPVTSTIGSAAGDVLGSVYGARGVSAGADALGEAAPYLKPALAAAGRALTPAEGDGKLLNIGKEALGGALAGAGTATLSNVTGANPDASPLMDAGIGAGAGPLGALGSSLADKGLTLLRDSALGRRALPQIGEAGDRALRLLAKHMKTPIADLRQRFAQVAATGIKPNLAMLSGPIDQGELAQLAAKNPEIVSRLMAASHGVDADLPPAVSNLVTQATPPQIGANVPRTPSLALDKANQEFHAQRALIDNRPVDLTPDDHALFSHTAVRQAASSDPALRENGRYAKVIQSIDPEAGEGIGEEGAEGGEQELPMPLTVRDLDSVRQELREKQMQNAGKRSGDTYKSLADMVSNHISDQHPEYGQMLGQYERRRNFISGMTKGEAGEPFQAHANPMQPTQGELDTTAGHRFGLVTGLARRGAQGDNEAMGVLHQLAQAQGGVVNNLRAANGPAGMLPGVEALNTNAGAMQRAVQAQRAITPGIANPAPDENMHALARAGTSAMLGEPHTTSWNLSRYFSSRGLPPVVSQRFGQAIANRDHATVAKLLDQLDKAHGANKLAARARAAMGALAATNVVQSAGT